MEILLLARLRNCRSQPTWNNTHHQNQAHFAILPSKSQILSEEGMKLSLCLMFKHLADDKWLGQEKLPAMIVWKKKFSKSHHLALDHWITDSLSLLTLTWPIRQEAVGLKEKISTKTRWRSSFWNWTMKEKKRNSSYVLLLWFGGR